VQLYFTPRDCKGGGNIPGSHFAKAFFSSPIAVLMMSVASPNRRPFNVDFSQRNRYKQAAVIQKSMGYAPVLSNDSLLRNSLPESTGVLEYCREGETNCWFPFFRGFPFCPHP